MSPTRRNLWLAIAGVAAVQAAVLGWMIWERVHLLSSGREITLEVVPVDPRSLFRGDYVVLNYDISSVETPAGKEPLGSGSALYVTLQKTPDGKWQVARTDTTAPEGTGEDQITLKGRVHTVFRVPRGSPGKARVRYGIESFFVPEGTGRELEKLVREKKLSALIAVDEDGNAGIKGLVVDGKRVYVEPLL